MSGSLSTTWGDCQLHDTFECMNFHLHHDGVSACFGVFLLFVADNEICCLATFGQFCLVLQNE